jgi:hypothetical protein
MGLPIKISFRTSKSDKNWASYDQNKVIEVSQINKQY